MSTDLTKHGEMSIDWAQQRLEQLKKEQAERKSRAGFLGKLAEGKTMLRLGPPWKPGIPSAIKEVWLHKLRAPEDIGGIPKANIPCPLKNHGKACAICRKCKELKSTGSKTDRDLAYAWSAQQRYFAQVVNLEKLDEGWKVWEFGDGIFLDILKITSSEDTGGDVTHPVTGRNLIVDRTGTGMKDTRYKVLPSMKSSKFPKPELLSTMMDLDVLSTVWEPDRMEAALRGEYSPADKEEAKTEDSGTVDAEYTQVGE